MLDFLLDPAVWASLLSLAALEIVLGIDNVVFISLISSSLPHDKARLARVRSGLRWRSCSESRCCSP